MQYGQVMTCPVMCLIRNIKSVLMINATNIASTIRTHGLLHLSRRFGLEIGFFFWAQWSDITYSLLNDWAPRELLKSPIFDKVPVYMRRFTGLCFERGGFFRQSPRRRL